MKPVMWILVFALIAMAACSEPGTGGTTSASVDLPPSSTPTSTETPTTTFSAPTTSTTQPSVTTTLDPSTTIPIPDTEGETDFEVIWQELIEYHNWAFQNPKDADLTLYLSEECECFAKAQSVIDEYLTNGWRETSPGYTVHDIDVDISTSTFALMTVIDEHSVLEVVDESGAIVRERDLRPKTIFDVGVRLTPKGWRITEWFQRGEVGNAE